MMATCAAQRVQSSLAFLKMPKRRLLKATDKLLCFVILTISILWRPSLFRGILNLGNGVLFSRRG
ncbi:hypothetical protein HanRHA438_Chr14g0672921 [Helianthus annuus]|nr:hypothetical protein HanRHA438_Chr14g0672921 [Helianthus annuus]